MSAKISTGEDLTNMAPTNKTLASKTFNDKRHLLTDTLW